MYYLIFILWLVFASITESQVIGIMDGDTIELRAISKDPRSKSRLGKNIRVRLLHIDCPEKGQRFYKEAKRKCSDLCFKKNVIVLHNNRYDKYGRLLAEVQLPNGSILNQELLKDGLAIHFKKYSSSFLYSQMEIKARLAGKGIWSK